ASGGQRQPLQRDRARVLDPGVADVALGHAERLGETLHRLVRRHPALLNADVDVRARAAGLVERDLLDAEVLGLVLQRAARARQILRQEAHARGAGDRTDGGSAGKKEKVRGSDLTFLWGSLSDRCPIRNEAW